MSYLRVVVVIGSGVNRHSIVLSSDMDSLSICMTIPRKEISWTHPDDDSARLVISTDLEI